MKVYVVTYYYNHQGESVEAVYATRAEADKHPSDGDADSVKVQEFEVLDLCQHGKNAA
jgi:hypothetical protein